MNMYKVTIVDQAYSLDEDKVQEWGLLGESTWEALNTACMNLNNLEDDAVERLANSDHISIDIELIMRSPEQEDINQHIKDEMNKLFKDNSDDDIPDIFGD